MYYITKRDSETGKKFQVLLDEMKNVRAKAFDVAKRFGTEKIVPESFCIAGGIYAFVEPAIIDKKVLVLAKKSPYPNTYTPNGRTKEGKELLKELRALPTIEYKKLNAIVNYKDNWSNIGYNLNNDEYFGFTIKEEWQVNVPYDCEEVTTTRYRELFKN